MTDSAIFRLVYGNVQPSIVDFVSGTPPVPSNLAKANSTGGSMWDLTKGDLEGDSVCWATSGPYGEVDETLTQLCCPMEVGLTSYTGCRLPKGYAAPEATPAARWFANCTQFYAGQINVSDAGVNCTDMNTFTENQVTKKIES